MDPCDGYCLKKPLKGKHFFKGVILSLLTELHSGFFQVILSFTKWVGFETHIKKLLLIRSLVWNLTLSKSSNTNIFFLFRLVYMYTPSGIGSVCNVKKQMSLPSVPWQRYFFCLVVCVSKVTESSKSPGSWRSAYSNSFLASASNQYSIIHRYSCIIVFWPDGWRDAETNKLQPIFVFLLSRSSLFTSVVVHYDRCCNGDL